MRVVSLCLAAATLLVVRVLPAMDAVTTSPSEASALRTDEATALDRVAEARASRSADLRQRFALAGLPYPPAAIFLRAFKHECELELWALPATPSGDDGAGNRPARFRRVHTYPIQAASGVLGPKRQEGDGQVPEGVYRIDRFNPRSRFYLSLGLDYPNASDLARTTNPAAPGSDIFIHGGSQSAGCLAVGDAAIGELYLAALDTRELGGQTEIFIHVFPCRMTADNRREVLAPHVAERPELGAFWRELQPIFETFDRELIPPAVTVDAGGVYRLD